MASYSLQHVSPGQQIKAGTINSIIDAVGGDGWSSDGSWRRTTTGVVAGPGVPFQEASLAFKPGQWNVDPVTLKVHGAWLAVGEKTYGACLVFDDEQEDGQTVGPDFYHLIDFGRKAIEDGDFKGDYYLRVSNSILNDPDSVMPQEDLSADVFEFFSDENLDPENVMKHYYEIQVVKDDVKNGGESSLDDTHGINVDDCRYFKFFTIFGPKEGEKDEEGNQAKTLPPYDIRYYARSFAGGFGGDTAGFWKLRWMPTSNEDPAVGEWQIYMPLGCASIDGEPYFPKNETGVDQNGDVVFNWYALSTPNDQDADIVTSGGSVWKQWTVYVHFRDFPMMYASTVREDPDFTGAADRITVGTIMQKEWTPEGGTRQVSHSTTQARSSAYARHFDNDGSFKIVFKCEGARKEESSWKTILTNQFITFGRAQTWIEEDTDITEMEDVVLDIDHSTEDVSISITDEFKPNTIDHTYVKILRLENGGVVDDNRAEARKTWPFYAS